jgi:hypothetical protein
VEHQIEGLIAQGLALFEQGAGARLDPPIAGHVSRRRRQIGQYQLRERLAGKMPAGKESTR